MLLAFLLGRRHVSALMLGHPQITRYIKRVKLYSMSYECGIQGGSNMTGTCAACLHTNQSRPYLNHLVYSNIQRDLVVDDEISLNFRIYTTSMTHTVYFSPLYIYYDLRMAQHKDRNMSTAQ